MSIEEKPICEKCGKYMSPAGGIVGRDINFHKCFNCGTRTDDAEFVVLQESKYLV